jgi:hypothetical protein
MSLIKAGGVWKINRKGETNMVYTRPQVLNVKRASQSIQGQPKRINGSDSDTPPSSTVVAYRSDE